MSLVYPILKTIHVDKLALLHSLQQEQVILMLLTLQTSQGKKNLCKHVACPFITDKIIFDAKIQLTKVQERSAGATQDLFIATYRCQASTEQDVGFLVKKLLLHLF